MKFRLISDLHLEFHHKKERLILDKIKPSSDREILVLAGDISLKIKTLKETLNILKEKFNEIIYVPGNHEYYGKSAPDFHQELKDTVKSYDNVIFLDNDLHMVNGLKIFGGTMWFKENKKNHLSKMYMSDFSQIQRFEPWVYSQNKMFIENIEKFSNIDIVISHHLPSSSCTPIQYKNSQLNSFFVCDLEKQIRLLKPKFWFHGHTHYPVNLKIDNTIILANPHGYPNENTINYDPLFTVEV